MATSYTIYCMACGARLRGEAAERAEHQEADYDGVHFVTVPSREVVVLRASRVADFRIGDLVTRGGLAATRIVGFEVHGERGIVATIEGGATAYLNELALVPSVDTEAPPADDRRGSSKGAA